MKRDRGEELETLANAAHRLLAKLDERAKKASGGFKRPEKFENRGQSPAAPVAGETKQPGGTGAKSHPRSTAGLGGGASSSRFVLAANDNADRVTAEGFRPVETEAHMRRSATDAGSNVSIFTVRGSNVRRDEF